MFEWLRTVEQRTNSNQIIHSYKTKKVLCSLRAVWSLFHHFYSILGSHQNTLKTINFLVKLALVAFHYYLGTETKKRNDKKKKNEIVERWEQKRQQNRVHTIVRVWLQHIGHDIITFDCHMCTRQPNESEKKSFFFYNQITNDLLLFSQWTCWTSIYFIGPKKKEKDTRIRCVPTHGHRLALPITFRSLIFGVYFEKTLCIFFSVVAIHHY